ncbi:MAG: FliI/YscN family ATPase [Pseudomonadota bacterium]
MNIAQRLNRYKEAIADADFSIRKGRVSDCHGLVVESIGPMAYIGETCEILPQSDQPPVHAEVVGLRGGKVLLMPYGDLSGVGAGSEVIAHGSASGIGVGESLLGRVIDAFGNPIDGKGPVKVSDTYPTHAKPINPLSRQPIRQPLETGIRAIDALLTLGRGQRVGIFSGSGVGKSTLLGMIARNTDSDLNVIALIGERGKEVPEFIQKNLGPAGLKKSVVVAATSDQPALVRTRAAFSATAIAEYFRDCGKHVTLIMDSVTRFAMAQREIGLAVGEPPTARGYTPSVFNLLPKLLERCGTSNSGGSITALYTVLVEGDDMNDIMADTLRSILDGHIVLSRELAHHGQYPAIDLLASISRSLPDLVSQEQQQVIQRVISLLGAYQRSRDIVELGAYKSGTNSELDQAIQLRPKLLEYLRQKMHEITSREQAVSRLKALVS